MDDLEARMEANHERLEQKVDASNTRLESKIDQSNQRLEAMLRELLTSRSSTVDSSLPPLTTQPTPPPIVQITPTPTVTDPKSATSPSHGASGMSTEEVGAEQPTEDVAAGQPSEDVHGEEGPKEGDTAAAKSTTPHPTDLIEEEDVYAVVDAQGFAAVADHALHSGQVKATKTQN